MDRVGESVCVQISGTRRQRSLEARASEVRFARSFVRSFALGDCTAEERVVAVRAVCVRACVRGRAGAVVRRRPFARLQRRLKTVFDGGRARARRIKEFVFWRRFLWRLRKLLRKSYEKERAVAVAAVVSASRVACSVYQKLVAADTATKGDKSPVTVADLAAQAIVLAELAKAFPNDPVVAEETTAPLNENTPQSQHVRLRA